MFTYQIEEDPKTFQQAINSQDVSLWKKAMDDVIKSINNNNNNNNRPTF